MRYLTASSLFLALAVCFTSGLGAQSAGLVAHWTFDDPTNPLLDVVGGHQGAFAGSATTSKTNMPPIRGNVAALELPRDGAFVWVPQHADFNFAPKQPMSYAVWLRLTKPRHIYHVLGNRKGCASAIHYQVHRDSAAGLTFRSGPVSASGGGLPANQWSHFAVTFDGSTLRLYFDGVETGKRSGFSFHHNSSTADLLIGQSGTCTPNTTFIGQMDDFRLYDRALPQREIALLAGRVPASFKSFGTACASVSPLPALSATTLPRINTTFTLRVSNLAPFTVGVLLFGISDTTWNGIPLPLDLSVLGMKGCNLLVSWEMQVGPFAAPQTGGTVEMDYPIPNDPRLAGLTFYNQAWVIDAKANAFGVGTSNGGKGVIGY